MTDAPTRRFLFASAAAFLVTALAIYSTALTIPFVADDWEFLQRVHEAGSPVVCFEVLAGRFVRPVVVLIYYAGYTLFGLWSLPSHVFAVLLHALNAWLLCLLAIALDRGNRRWSGLAAGVLFLAFAGHSEAVAWVAGIADVIVAAFALAMLLAEERALGAARTGRWLVLVWLFAAMALLAKESAVVLPVMLAGYCVARGAPLRRVISHAGPPLLVVCAFLILRTWIYEWPADAYAGLGAHEGGLASYVRALLIRCFLPPSQRVADAWQRGLDIPFLLAGGILIAALIASRRVPRGVMLFSLFALAVTVAPALPLSISLATSESERMLYVPTAFAALITVLTIDGVVRRRAAAMGIVALLIAGHVVLLQRMNNRWRDAGAIFAGVTRTLVEEIRSRSPASDSLVLVMSLPDSVRGAYTFRRGLDGALHFLAPDLAARAGSIIAIESQTLTHATDVAVATQTGPMTFSLDVSPNIFLGVAPPERPFYRFTHWDRSRYTVELTPVVGRATVLSVSGPRVRFIASVQGAGAPFGTIDIPQDEASCDTSLRFSGWALDDREVTRIVVTRIPTISGRTDEPLRPLGDATWATGTRPDVVAAYRGFRWTDRAEWNYELPCGILDSLPGREAKVSVRAIDAEGNTTELGARTVRRRAMVK